MYQKCIIFLFLISIIQQVSCDTEPLQDYCVPNTKHTNSNTMLSQCKNSREVTPDDFVFSGLVGSTGNFTDTGLSAVSVGPTLFPGLNTLGMSFVRATLKPGGINPPHYHARATEVAYVLSGRVYSGFVDSTNRVLAKVIGRGEVMVFPKGLVHFQMNVGRTNATIFGCFNSQNPGIQKIPGTMFGSGINDELLEKAFGLSIAQIAKLRRRFFPKKQV